MVKSKENLLGAYAFLIGIVLAVVLGLFSESIESGGDLFYSILIIIGLIIGFVNTNDKSSQTFLFAGLAIVVVCALGVEALKFISLDHSVVASLREVLSSLSLLFIPSTIVAALKTVFSIAKI